MPFNTTQDPYLDLRNVVAERTRPLLAWVGSGLSAAANLPTWAGLRSVLVEGLKNKAETLPTARKSLLATAERARTEPNPWIAFEILATALGETTFRDLVRRPFSEAYRTPTPTGYPGLWRLGIKGMLTLNLDRFAARSLTEVSPHVTHIELSGASVGRLRSNLSGPRPIVANLHGVIEDTETWVLTHRQLSAALKRPNYRSFIDTCLSMFTLIFMGISVDDVAVGGHLERLTRQRVEHPTCYWITDRRDYNVDKWAESVGIRVIRYANEAGDHQELTELIDDLTSYVPHDIVLDRPVQLTSRHDLGETRFDAQDLPPEDELLSLGAEELRRVLNAHAHYLLSAENEAAYTAYDEFSRAYDQAIYRAWYASTADGKNDLLGYRLVERVARGAFGTVYRSEAPDGAQVAVKILLDEVRREPQALQSFRRGVRSMQILSSKSLPGVVRYLEASEIPAFVTMEWIEGPNLGDAKESQQLQDWGAVLEIACQLVKIIRSAHSLPERVLHRDIRPENIMLRDFWMDPGSPEVVVLDFDLSWHVGAQEKSVLHTSVVGYLAPEQLSSIHGTTTRSAAVDAFGVGMTLFFLTGGVEPIPDQHLHTDWESAVARACSTLPKPEWRSLPVRFTRLILGATRHDPSSRWDLGQMERELALLTDAHRHGEPSDAEILAEELAARSDVFREYVWDADRPQAVKDNGTGLRLTLGADLENEEVTTSMSYTGRGTEDRAKLNRYIDDVTGMLKAQLRREGWRVDSATHGYGDMTLTARMDVHKAGRALSRMSASLDSIYGRLAFDRL